jgi:hypothetical protein
MLSKTRKKTNDYRIFVYGILKARIFYIVNKNKKNFNVISSSFECASAPAMIASTVGHCQLSHGLKTDRLDKILSASIL